MLFWSLVCHIELSKVCHNLLWFFKLWSPKVLGLTYKLFTSFLLDTIAFFNWIPLFMKSRPATDVKHLLITYSKKFFTFNLPLQNVLAFQISSSFYHNIFFLIFFHQILIKYADKYWPFLIYLDSTLVVLQSYYIYLKMDIHKYHNLLSIIMERNTS